jgi:uncharacterized protein with PIN domain
MSWKRERLKKALLTQLEGEVDRLLENIVDEQPLTLREIEACVLETRTAIGQTLIQAVVEVESQALAPDEYCEQCGQRMQNKGKKPKQLTTQSGEVVMERAYYYCPGCRKGFFPPG